MSLRNAWYLALQCLLNVAVDWTLHNTSIVRLANEPNIAVEIEALVTLLYMLVVSHEDDQEFIDELG